MIKTSRQLKDKVRNLSGGNSAVAQSYMRTYVMEQFLYRVAASKYKDKFILKGGLLVANIIGNDLRTTMDIDTTVKALPLSIEYAKNIIEEIVSIDVGDNMTFEISAIGNIMDEFEYPGVRVVLVGHLDNMRQTITIDISTNDVITPSEVNFEYETIFGEKINLLSYNLETILAEKLESILSKSLNNTRMKDYYDLKVIPKMQETKIDYKVVKKAFECTVKHRGSIAKIEDSLKTLNDFYDDPTLNKVWDYYKTKNPNANEYTWNDMVDSVKSFIERIDL